jgi:hypothetical protein
MQQAAATHWRAAAWLLERTDPDHFGRRNPHQPTVEDLDTLFEQLFEAINEEITDPQLSRRVYNRLIATINSDDSERWAARHRRRDPTKAKRFYPAFSDEELRQADPDIEATLQRLQADSPQQPPPTNPEFRTSENHPK